MGSMNTTNLTFEQGLLVGAGGVAVVLIVLLILRPWRRAFFSGAPIPLATIVGMRLRGNPPNFLINAYLELVKSGVTAPVDLVECVYMKHRSEIRTPHDLAELSRTIAENQRNEISRHEAGQWPHESL